MQLKEQILSIANEHLSDESHFIVDIVISSTKGPKKVLILLDGDDGVNIDNCADLSRVVSDEIEEKELIADAYRLEVSSPGLDFPLAMARQYEKNIGRNVKVTMDNGKDYKGELLAHNQDNLTVEVVKGKKKEKEVVELPIINIKKTIVQVSFK